jgi:membrane protein
MTELQARIDRAYARLVGYRAVDLLLGTLRRASAVRVPRMAAAMTFYLLLSLAPLLVVVVGVAGLVVGERAADIYANFIGGLGQYVGTRVVEVIAGLVAAQTRRPTEGAVATVVGVLALLASASRALNEFQDALDAVWDVAPPAGISRGVLRTVRRRALSILLTIAAGVILTAYVVVRPAVNTFGHMLAPFAPAAIDVVRALNAVFAYALITAVLASLYRFLPETRIRWGDVWLASLMVALVLTVGQVAFTAYLDFARKLGFLGAASSPLVILALADTAIQAVYFGAVFSRAYAERLGSRAPLLAVQEVDTRGGA